MHSAFLKQRVQLTFIKEWKEKMEGKRKGVRNRTLGEERERRSKVSKEGMGQGQILPHKALKN